MTAGAGAGQQTGHSGLTPLGDRAVTAALRECEQVRREHCACQLCVPRLLRAPRVLHAPCVPRACPVHARLPRTVTLPWRMGRVSLLLAAGSAPAH